MNVLFWVSVYAIIGICFFFRAMVVLSTTDMPENEAVFAFMSCVFAGMFWPIWLLHALSNRDSHVR